MDAQPKVPGLVFVITAVVGYGVAKLIMGATGLGGYVVGTAIVCISVAVTGGIGAANYRAVTK